MRNGKFWLIAFVAIVFIGGIISLNLAAHGNRQTITGVVTDKERIMESDGDGGTNSYYMVWIDGEPFKNVDSVIEGKWDSSTVQGKLQVGQEVKVEVYGWRVPFLSMYKNIAEVK